MDTVTAGSKLNKSVLYGETPIISVRQARLPARLRGSGVGVLVVTLTAGLLTAVPWPVAAAPATPRPPHVPSVHGVTPKPARPAHPHNDAAVAWHAPKVSWPAAGSATVDLTRVRPAADAETRPGQVVTQGAAAASVTAGPLPVRIGRVSAAGPSQVSVSLLDRAAAQRVAVDGLLLTVTPTGPDAGIDVNTGAGQLSVSVDYGMFAGAYGGNFADRLRLVTLPSCAMTTPWVASCQVQSPLETVNNRAAKTVTARVNLADARSTSTMVLAATSAPAGGSGDYTATALKPSGSWTAGGGSGDFSYSYPDRGAAGPRRYATANRPLLQRPVGGRRAGRHQQSAIVDR